MLETGEEVTSHDNLLNWEQPGRSGGWKLLQLYVQIRAEGASRRGGNAGTQVRTNVKLAGMNSSAVPGQVEPGFSGKKQRWVVLRKVTNCPWTQARSEERGEER
jgi:hypothetical protein